MKQYIETVFEALRLKYPHYSKFEIKTRRFAHLVFIDVKTEEKWFEIGMYNLDRKRLFIY